MNILFADDDPFQQELVTMWLTKRKHDVTVVSSGKELLRVLQNGPGNFDAIITDNNMPGGPSGLDVLRQLRSDDRFKKVPIIVHSGDAAELLKAEVEALDAVFASKRQHGSLLGAVDDLST